MCFPNFVSSIQAIDDEWRKLRFTNIPFDYTDIPVDEFWGRLGHNTDDNEVPFFGTVCKFMKCLFALPHSGADAERHERCERLISYKGLYKILPSTWNDWTNELTEPK